MTGKDEVTPPASKSLSAMLEQGKTIASVQENLPEVHKVPLKDVEKPVDVVTSTVDKSVEKLYETPTKFIRGDVLMDLDRDVRVVVVRAAIGFTRKGEPFYRVVDKSSGENWIQKESRLRKTR